MIEELTWMRPGVNLISSVTDSNRLAADDNITPSFFSQVSDVSVATGISIILVEPHAPRPGPSCSFLTGREDELAQIWRY